MEKIIRNPFVVVPAIIILFASILYFTFHSNHRSSPISQAALAEKTLIQDEMRIIVTPLTYLPNTEPTFKIQLECYQHPELTRLDLMATTLLQTNTGKPLIPIKWEISKQDQYLTVGIITFPATPVTYSHIKFTIFGNSEMIFDWDIPK